MAFSFRETQLVKGMLARGDKQHDIAAYFGVNGGRVAEVATGDCDYPTAPAAPADRLPPPGPYVSLRTKQDVINILEEAAELIDGAGNASEEAAFASDVLKTALEKLR
ncbi:hypothetical protein U879_10810 [Defluviimonas sp. 20V17]|uniref:Uncharacterized protein n=1 Tax=Allgaiera indica TaxID=765699 RepID=A0AAN4UP84_9RHOB|nr:hypothetical protein [Allgaiera indica]KDB03736.1 hypothetical protein U879_10810 [Defluviimonas sp. 20V17]GHD99799.1 hypothetical protein GCM10008024_08790 [Allgaiera indica]SDW43640.1 hypothetical protein SAMN05444006_103212 [Allgaiera indica]